MGDIDQKTSPQPPGEESDFVEGYHIVVLCLECKQGQDASNNADTRMIPISGSYMHKGGFIFECPKCSRKVAIAYVYERFADRIQVTPSKRKNKKTILDQY